MACDSNTDKMVENVLSPNKYIENDEDNSFIRGICEIIDRNKFNYSRMIRTSKHKDMLEWIMKKTRHICETDDITVTTRLYMIFHNMDGFPVCKTCGKVIRRNVISLNDGFIEYCNTKCSMNDESVREKIRMTDLNKYGCENHIAAKCVREKILSTFQDRYGVSQPMKIKKFVDKIYETKKERYGDGFYNNFEKSISTCREKYGCDFVFQSDDFKRKSENTCMERYGIANGGGSKTALEKTKETNLERYGVEYSSKVKATREKARLTNLRRYNTEHPFNTTEVHARIREAKLRKSYKNKVLGSYLETPMFDEEFYVKYHSDDFLFKFKCCKCGFEFQSKHTNGCHSHCPICYPVEAGTSHEEQDLYDFLCENYKGTVIRHDRKTIAPYELDIVLPEIKVAIEFDGLFWHSVLGGKDGNYHLSKTNMCERLGFRLIHVFENEWISKNEIVKSRLMNILGISSRRVYARKCSVEYIDGSDSMSFQEENHLQGGVRSKINMGLVHEGEIVAVMTFSKPRFSRNYDYELVRFCTKTGYSVVGGASKLLKHFVTDHDFDRMVSYADRRWSSGNLYESLGFSFVRNSNPNYFYFKNNGELMSRHNFQKHKLSGILEKFNENDSEMKNMISNGYNVVYDCGNKVYELKRNEYATR